MFELTCSRLSFLIFILAQNISCTKHDDSLGAFLYEDLKCTTKDGNSYDCDFAAKNHCIYAGKKYEIGEKIEDIDVKATCFLNCTCLEGGSFSCGEDFCPLRPNTTVYPDCRYKYFSDSCCPEQTCEPSKVNCTVDGETEEQGALFYPNNTCLLCFCEEGFSGKLEAPYCKKRKCFVQLENMIELLNKCAPIFLYRDCCPAYWICNQTQQIVKLWQDDSKSGLFCEFGKGEVPYGHGFETVIKTEYEDVRAKCECSLPPLMTCDGTRINEKPWNK